MRLSQQPKHQRTLDNYKSNLKPEVIKFINSKTFLNLCKRIIRKNPNSPIQDIIIHDVLIEKYSILISVIIIRRFLENKGISYNKKQSGRRKGGRKIRTDENILSIKY